MIFAFPLSVPSRQAWQDNTVFHGFCYHYYWFSGRRILQRPLDEVLSSGEPDFPFCICWANEPWSRRWDGSDTDLLIAQEHDLETDKRLILDLLPLFRDRRYIKVDGKPLLVIYRVGLLPDPRALSRFWREVARENGFPDLHICMAETLGSMTRIIMVAMRPSNSRRINSCGGDQQQAEKPSRGLFGQHL